jgi:hypothetical protein
VKTRQQKGLGSLPRESSVQDHSVTVRILVTLLFLALAARSSSDFFHTEGPVGTGPAISAPCNACELQGTSALDAPPPPALPSLTVSEVEAVIPAEAHPFTPPIVRMQGRAPPTR